MINPLLDGGPDGLPDFTAIRAEHVEPALQATLDINRAELARLIDAAEGNAPSFENLVLPLEALGDRLQRMWSPVSHLNAVANSTPLRDAYNACLPLLSRYQTEIAQNTQLFALFERVLAALPADRGDGARPLLEHALRDFRLAGVALPAAQKQRFMEITEALAELQAKFEQNLLDSMAAWSHHETVRARLDGLPQNVLERAAATAAEAGKPGWLFHLDQPTYLAVLTHARDRELRALFHRAWATRASDEAPAPAPFDNSSIMEQILALRHEAAALVGFGNFAGYALATRMATSVAEVVDFLARLASASREAAQRDFADLAQLAGHALEPWDIAYYSEELRRQKYAISDEELRPYFPLPRVLDGLFALVERLYGIRFEAVPERALWDPQARYFRVRNAAGEVIGGLCTDFYARTQKRSGAWMDDCVSRMRHGGQLQKPVAHLVCNFAPPGPQTPSLLSHDEVLTLFHEMGHVLHHLLTRVDYPSVGGIHGVPWDAVELPSQFMEGFAWEPQILRMLCGHYQSNEPLPEHLVERLQASRVYQGGLYMMRQIEFALFDLRLHAEYEPARGGRVMELLREVRSAIAVVPAAAYDRMPHGFAHVFGGGYAAGYYSYKWAEVLSADAFAAFEEQGVLDAGLARRFREQILEIGGTRDIGAAFRAFRGRAPDITALLRQDGILPAGSAAATPA